MVAIVKEAGIPDWGGRLYLRINEAFQKLTPQTAVLTVATLQTATVALAGARGFVKDANATTFYSIVATGGANYVPVFCDGVHWRIG